MRLSESIHNGSTSNFLNEMSKVNESSTEEYWDATELDRELFMSLLKFNFGNDSKGNNYIITNDAYELKRFHANNDEDAKNYFRGYLNLEKDNFGDYSVEDDENLKKEYHIDESEELKEDSNIDGQMSFDDLESNNNSEENKNQNDGPVFKYYTEFNLASPVNDFEAAQSYLTEDDMTQYLLDDDRIPQSGRDKVKSVTWDLEDDDRGTIWVVTNAELTEEESSAISDWIGGQNSDGLGEGFEQQSFAENYYNPETGEGPFTYDEAEREIEAEIERLVEEQYEDYLEVDVDEATEEDIERAQDECRDDLSRPGSMYSIDDWFTMSSFDWQTNNYKLNLKDMNESEELDESALTEKYSYKETLEKELEKVQDMIANSDPNKDISGLEEKRDWLMNKLNDLEESALNEAKGRKLSFEEYKDLYDPHCNLTDDELYQMWKTDKDELYTDEDIEAIRKEVEGFFEMDESALNEADGWIAFYNGNKVEITKDEAHDLWSAKQVAIKKLNVPKSKVSLVAVEPAYNESALNEDDSFYNELEVTSYRPTGQDEGALANMKIKSKFGELEVNLLNIDGEYRLVTPNMWRTKEEEELINNLVNEYGMQGLIDFAADYHYKKSHSN